MRWKNANNAPSVFSFLKDEYPRANTALRYNTPFQLLVSTILSAQCTDARVNAVTQNLFKKYASAEDFASAAFADLAREIRSTGFYRHKAKNIIAAAKMIMERFRGEVPRSMDELVLLPGVARKTANIVLFHAFKKNEGLAVDTHVRRVSQRLGLTGYDDPEKIERDLTAALPREHWGRFSDLLIEHGRKVCPARAPKCPDCVLNKICAYYRALREKTNP